jgi:hypothetical protein
MHFLSLQISLIKNGLFGTLTKINQVKKSQINYTHFYYLARIWYPGTRLQSTKFGAGKKLSIQSMLFSYDFSN